MLPIEHFRRHAHQGESLMWGLESEVRETLPVKVQWQKATACLLVSFQ